MSRSYWTRMLESRVGRRRLMVGAGGSAAAAAFLAACGGSSNKNNTSTSSGGSSTGGSASSGGASSGSSSSGSSGSSGANGLIWQPVDDTKNAKAGGTYVGAQTNAPSSLDPHQIGAHVVIVGRTYSQLFRIKGGTLKNTDGTYMGDLAQSWEMSPDKMTLTVKLEPNAGFAPIAPVNGRLVDADDVTFSWGRVEKQGTLRGDLAHSVSPDAPIVSMTAPDKNTVVIKLAEPNATIFTLLGHNGLGSLFILPKEAADTNQLDVKGTLLGSGPYQATEANTSVNFQFKKNPNFKRSSLKHGEPYIEEIHTPVIPDPATLSAQFLSGQIYDTTVPPLEVFDDKKKISQLLMYATDPPVTERVYFGYNDGSPFKDERVRIAYYKTIDRDAYVQAAYNADKYAQQGLSVEQFWEGSFEQASWAGWLLDPKSKSDYGAAQSNFVYDVAEAKKMVEAAGFTTPLEFVYNRSAPGPTSFAQPIYDRMQIMEGMLDDSGVFKRKLNDLQWATEWLPQIRRAGGKFNGSSWGPDTTSFDTSWGAFYVYNPSGGYYEGGDDTLAKMALDIRKEFDVDKRKALVKQLQQYDAAHMFNQKLGVATGFALVWPIVRNVHVFRGGTNWMDITTGSDLNAWIDPTQPPKQ